MGWGLCKDMLGLSSLGHMDLKFQGMPFARFDHSLKVPRVIERHALFVIKKYMVTHKLRSMNTAPVFCQGIHVSIYCDLLATYFFGNVNSRLPTPRMYLDRESDRKTSIFIYNIYIHRTKTTKADK